MTQNANKFVVRLSNWSLLISFCGVLVTSAIDVVPSLREIHEFYCCFFLFSIYHFVGYPTDNVFLSILKRLNLRWRLVEALICLKV